MLTRTHLLFSILIFFLFFRNFGLLFFSFLILGTLLIDIDSAKSKIGKNILLKPIQFFLTHRGILHTPIFAVFICLIVYYFNRIAGIGFFIGCFSHLILDFTTKSGIKLFWPLYGRNLGLGIKTGGIIEEVFFVFLLLVNIYLAFNFFF